MSVGNRPTVSGSKGVAAIEAALILPVLVLLFVMAVDVADLLLTDQRLVRSTRSMADLIARQHTVNDSQLAGIEKAANTILTPYNTDEGRYAAALVQYDGDGDASLRWKKTLNGGSLPSPVAEAGRIELENDSVVVVRGTVTWQPLLTADLIGERTLGEVQIARPRLTRIVEYE